MDLETARHERAEVDRAIDGQTNIENAPSFAILPADWTAGSDELTPTVEVRRRIVYDKYRVVIDAMCAAPPGGGAPPAA